MAYIKLLAPRGEYPIGTRLRILGPGEDPAPGTIDSAKAQDLVEKYGQANYDADEPEAVAEAASAPENAEPVEEVADESVDARPAKKAAPKGRRK